MHSAQAILANSEAPIMVCPVCKPERPMVIKSVTTSFRGKSQTITFECAACGADLQTSAPPSPADPARTDSFKQDRSPR